MKKRMLAMVTGIMVMCMAACSGEPDEPDTQGNPVNSRETDSSSNNAATGTEEKTTNNSSSDEITLEALMAHEVVSEKDIYCMDMSDTESSLEEYTGTDPILVFPEEYKGIPVTHTAEYSLANDSVVEAVRFSDTIVEIDKGTCANNEKLKFVVFGDSVKKIGQSAFLNCISLKEIVLNEGMEKIDTIAFGGCENLEKVTIPSSVTEIASDAFHMTSDDLTIYGEAGSYAETYANENGIKFVAQ